MQAQTDQINVRIDTSTKLAAEMVFGLLGLSATDAVRMFYRQVAMRQGLPFEAKVVTPVRKKEKDREKMRARIEASIRRNQKTLEILATR